MTTRRSFLASLMATAAVGLPKPSGDGIAFTAMEHPSDWSILTGPETDLSEASVEGLMIQIRDSWSYYSYPSKDWNRQQMRGLAAPLREVYNRNLLNVFNSVPAKNL